MQVKTPYLKKIKDAYVRQSMSDMSVINIIPFLYEMRNTALFKA